MIDEEILSVVKEIREKLGYAEKLSSVEITKTTRDTRGRLKHTRKTRKLRVKSRLRLMKNLRKSSLLRC